MRVGILTFHCAPSHGAFFQAYALAKCVEQMGHDAVVLDYMPAHRSDALVEYCNRIPWSWRRLGFNGVNLIRYRRRRLFRREANRFLPLTKQTYESIEDIRTANLHLDACIVGSDQIWNPKLTGGNYDPVYFGAFGPDTMRRISYAPSLGRSEVPQSEIPILNDLLAQLDCISVREPSGTEIIKRVTARQVVQVLDPTFLIAREDYPRVSDWPQKRKPYVLAYALGEDECFKQHVAATAQAFEMPVLSIGRDDGFPRYKFPPSPLDLLGLIQNAHHVVTSSFHGVALCLIHHVNFTAVAGSGEYAAGVCRVEELLALAGLSHRFVAQGSAHHVDLEPIDWMHSDNTLRSASIHSREFLLQALEGCNAISQNNRNR